MRPSWLLALSALLLVATSCTRGNQPLVPPQEIHSARAAWGAQELRSYRFDFERQCFCVREALEPVTIEVRKGGVHEVRSRRTGEVMPSSEAVPWYTIEQLFEQIEQAQREGIQPVRVEYHPSGYPTEIDIGSLAADAGVHYTVGNVEPLQ